MNETLTHPVVKIFSVNGVIVKLIKLKPDSNIGAKVYANGDDDRGLAVMNYLMREGMVSDSFLLSK